MALTEQTRIDLGSRSQSVVGTIIDDWKWGLTSRAQMDTLINGYWERYEAKAPKRDLPFKQASNLRIPLTMWVLDGVWVRLMRTVFGQKPYLSIADENLQRGPDANLLERVVEHLVDVDLGLRGALGHILTNALVEGTGIGKLCETADYRQVRDRQVRFNWATLSREDVLVEQDVLDRHGLSLEVLDLKDFVVANPAIPSVDKQPWVAHRVWLRWDEIRRRQKDGTYPITAEQLSSLKGYGKKRTDTGGPTDTTKATIDQAQDIGWVGVEEWEIVEMRRRFDVKEGGLEEECLFTVCVDWNQAPLRAETGIDWNGHRPYFVYRPIPRANRFYGRPGSGVLQPIQDEADTEINQNLDATTFKILAHLTPILSRSLKREWENHKWVLGKPIYVDAPEQFRTMADLIRHDFGAAGFNLGQFFAMAERAMGIADPQLGKPTAGSKTAFEIATVTQEGNVRFAEMVEQIQLTNQELGYQIVEHAYQMSVSSPAFRERLVGFLDGKDPFEGTSMRDIRQRIAVTPTGNTIVSNKEAEAKKWIGAMETFKDNPFVKADMKREWFLYAQTLRALGLSQYVDDIIGSEEELDQAKQMVASAAQQMTQGGGAMGALGDGQMPGEMAQDEVPAEDEMAMRGAVT